MVGKIHYKNQLTDNSQSFWKLMMFQDLMNKEFIQIYFILKLLKKITYQWHIKTCRWHRTPVVIWSSWTQQMIFRAIWYSQRAKGRTFISIQANWPYFKKSFLNSSKPYNYSVDRQWRLELIHTLRIESIPFYDWDGLT